MRRCAVFLQDAFLIRNDKLSRRCAPRPFLVLVCSLLWCVVVLGSSPYPSYAADHLDGPAASADPAADITDIYAWMQNEDSMNLILSVFPRANETSLFSDSVQYAFTINSQSGYGAVDQRNTLICTFSSDQRVSCDLNGEALVSDVDASSTSGATNDEGSFRIFTGLRDDPFVFESNNFNVVRRTVRDAAASLEFDDAGCPTVDAATQAVLVNALVGNGGLPGANNPPVNFFGSFNALSIVIQVNRSLFGSGPLYSVSASTHRQP